MSSMRDITVSNYRHIFLGHDFLEVSFIEHFLDGNGVKPAMNHLSSEAVTISIIIPYANRGTLW